MYKVVLSDYMKKQVTTMPPETPFKKYDEAYKWVLRYYGSNTLDSIIAGIDMGCHIIEV